MEETTDSSTRKILVGSTYRNFGPCGAKVVKEFKMADDKNKNAIWVLLLSLLPLLTTFQQNYKQLLDEVFVISGIIKVEVSVIS